MLGRGARISSGSDDVFIGGGTVQYLHIDDEIPGWLRVVVDVLMIVASMGKALVSVAKLGLTQGLKAAGPCALRFGATVAASYLTGTYIIGPAVGKVLGGFIGNPVDLTTGRKLLLDSGETDFVLPGLMPIEWSRFYASDLTVDSVLGQGWVLPWEQSLRRSGSFVYLTDNQGRSVPFVDIEPGERIYNPYEQIHLVRTLGGHYLLQTLDNVFFYFGEVPDDNTSVPLQRLENALGHYLHFTRTVEGTLTDISAPGGILGGRLFGDDSNKQKYMAFAGALLGGGLGAKGGEWFGARYEIKQEGLGSLFGNVKVVKKPLVPAEGPEGISPALYEKLRTKTPSLQIRKMVNKGVVLPMSDPALPGLQITKALHADHVVSIKTITEMDGFSNLTYSDQVAVLNYKPNFVGLSETANTSKGG